MTTTARLIDDAFVRSLETRTLPPDARDHAAHRPRVISVCARLRIAGGAETTAFMAVFARRVFVLTARQDGAV